MLSKSESLYRVLYMLQGLFKLLTDSAIFIIPITKANPILHIRYFSAALDEKCMSHKSTIAQTAEGKFRYKKFQIKH